MSKTAIPSRKKVNQNFLLEEYKQAVEYDRHLTSLNWQIAAIFFGGILIGLGQAVTGRFLLDRIAALGVIAGLGIVLVLGWFFLVSRNRHLSGIAK
jgi:hypothetical protein